MAREIPVTQARADLAELVNRVGYSGERVVLTRHGKALAALVPVADLEALERPADVGFGLGGPAQPAERPEPQLPPTPLRIAAEHREQGAPPGRSPWRY